MDLMHRVAEDRELVALFRRTLKARHGRRVSDMTDAQVCLVVLLLVGRP